jgi:uncharacterized protein
MDILSKYTLTQWLLILLAAAILGMAKAGLKGIDMMNVTIMALVFGSKPSTGIVLPLLCIADVLAVWYYKRHVQWPHFFKLLPWIVLGILLGVYIGKDINEALFKKIMAVIILLTIVIMVLLEVRKNTDVPQNKLFSASIGLSAGITTMLGNLAGAFANIYFLSMRMSKNNFIGTAAWLFLVINFFKLPFQVFYWKNINYHTLKIDLILVPALLIGFWAGLKLVAIIKDESYRKVVLALTLIGAIIMLL